MRSVGTRASFKSPGWTLLFASENRVEGVGSRGWGQSAGISVFLGKIQGCGCAFVGFVSASG